MYLKFSDIRLIFSKDFWILFFFYFFMRYFVYSSLFFNFLVLIILFGNVIERGNILFDFYFLIFKNINFWIEII